MQCSQNKIEKRVGIILAAGLAALIGLAIVWSVSSSVKVLDDGEHYVAPLVTKPTDVSAPVVAPEVQASPAGTFSSDDKGHAEMPGVPESGRN